MFIEIILEPDTKFTVMMVGPDTQKPGVTRIVLDVKETKPILESELGIFKSSYEDLELKKEEGKVNQFTKEALQVGRNLETGAIKQECPPTQFNFGNSFEGGMNMNTTGTNNRSGISFDAGNSEETARGGIQASANGENQAEEKLQPEFNNQEQLAEGTPLENSPIGLLLTTGGNQPTPINMAINQAFQKKN